MSKTRVMTQAEVQKSLAELENQVAYLDDLLKGTVGPLHTNRVAVQELSGVAIKLDAAVKASAEPNSKWTPEDLQALAMHCQNYAIAVQGAISESALKRGHSEDGVRKFNDYAKKAEEQAIALNRIGMQKMSGELKDIESQIQDLAVKGGKIKRLIYDDPGFSRALSSMAIKLHIAADSSLNWPREAAQALATLCQNYAIVVQRGLSRSASSPEYSEDRAQKFKNFSEAAEKLAKGLNRQLEGSRINGLEVKVSAPGKPDANLGWETQALYGKLISYARRLGELASAERNTSEQKATKQPAEAVKGKLLRANMDSEHYGEEHMNFLSREPNLPHGLVLRATIKQKALEELAKSVPHIQDWKTLGAVVKDARELLTGFAQEVERAKVQPESAKKIAAIEVRNTIRADEPKLDEILKTVQAKEGHELKR